jgi:hypothetical protein
MLTPPVPFVISVPPSLMARQLSGDYTQQPE